MSFHRPGEPSSVALDTSYDMDDPCADTRGPDPLSDNWAYDSAIDLFSLNTMIPETFALDLPSDLMDLQAKDLPIDPFAAPTGISGFLISNDAAEDAFSSASISSDIESEDQAWSPTCLNISPAVSFALDTPSPPPSKPNTATEEPRRSKPTCSNRDSPPTTRSSSSSPEIAPQDHHHHPSSPTSPTRRTSRSLSTDSTPTRNAAKRAAHNVIEKRYRTNMNAKFVALKQAISDTGISSKGGGSRAASLKKSEILTNAIAYIQELQEEREALRKEVVVLKQNLLPGGIRRYAKERR